MINCCLASSELATGYESGTCSDKATAEALTLAAMVRDTEFANKRRYFFAADAKTVYCLFYADGWIVDIIDAERTCPASWLSGRDSTFNEQCQRIREHLTQAYGGVTREL